MTEKHDINMYLVTIFAIIAIASFVMLYMFIGTPVSGIVFSNDISFSSTGAAYTQVLTDTSDNTQGFYAEPDQILPGVTVGPPPILPDITVGPPPILPDITVGPPRLDLTTGSLHACFLSRQADTIWCWGGYRIFIKQVIKEVMIFNNITNETIKQLQKVKIPETVVYSTPFIVRNTNGQPFKGAIAISAGNIHTCALKNDGTVWCWNAPNPNVENNNALELGDGTNTPSEFPVQVIVSENPKVPLQGIKAISAGAKHTCALKNDSTLWCWGYNQAGQLGDNSHVSSSIAVQVIANLQFTAVGAALDHTCAIDKDTALWCWGKAIQPSKFGIIDLLVPQPIVDGKNNQIKEVRTFAHGQLGFVFSAFQKIKDDSLWGIGRAIGSDVGGQNALIFDPPRQIVDSNNKPVRVKLASIYGANLGHGCFLDRGIPDTALCWGFNLHGQLGDGTTLDRQFPVLVKDPQGGAFTSLYQIEVGGFFTCAIRLKNKEEVWCWGWNYHGQLGDGTTKDSTIPVRVKIP